jgi:hypothetical protein
VHPHELPPAVGRSRAFRLTARSCEPLLTRVFYTTNLLVESRVIGFVIKPPETQVDILARRKSVGGAASGSRLRRRLHVSHIHVRFRIRSKSFHSDEA